MQSKEIQIKIASGVSIELVLVEGGRFEMGSNEEKREEPIHEVEVSSFYMSKYQITQKQWVIIIDHNPSYNKRENHPIELVSWEESQVFIEKLNAKTKESFRLPTESEWEYAARGGRYSQGFKYAGSDKLKQVGWYKRKGVNGSKEVGLLQCNELGLYDMSGNVMEWCEDDFHWNYKRAPSDGSAWIDTPNRRTHRVLRGGSFFSEEEFCRSTFRTWGKPDKNSGDAGFRLALSLQLVD